MYGGMGSGYGSSMYGGGLGGSMYGGGMGMGGMYGGMGSMGLGGMGMMGMGGMGMGMGGMGMGMGGMGMGMGGMMGESDQRGQMAFMLLGRCIEMFGMFSGVLQMVFGSIIQFMGSYVGLSQQYRQLNSDNPAALMQPPMVDENGNVIEQQPVYDADATFVSDGTRRRKKLKKSQQQQQQTWGSLLWSLIKRLATVALTYVIAVRVYRMLKSRWSPNRVPTIEEHDATNHHRPSASNAPVHHDGW